MTIEDAAQLAFTGKCPASKCIPFPLIVSNAVPLVRDHIAHVSAPKPLTQDDYNGLSCGDVMAMSQFKDMDALHRPDAVAQLHAQATGLRSILKTIGKDRFKQSYKK